MIFRGPFPSISIPEVSLTEFVLQRTNDFPDKTALIEGLTGRTITYRELRDEIYRAGEIPKAFVVLKVEAAAEEILDFVAARVAPYKRVRMLETIDKIPKSPSGKILRRVLVQAERERNKE